MLMRKLFIAMCRHIKENAGYPKLKKPTKMLRPVTYHNNFEKL